ncbi:MAG: post-PEP-CTERM-1 domain-containing protein [Lysobacter sp.]
MSTRVKAGLFVPGLFLLTLNAAIAAQPATPDTSAASSKVGIDAVTGKLRPLTAEESSALEQASSTTQQKSVLKANAMRGAIPADDAAARATERRFANGTVARKAPLSMMSSLTATRDASGKLVIQHSDPSDSDAAAQHEELPRE